MTKKIILVVLLALVFSAVQAQKGTTVQEKLDYYNQEYPQEKVYLHTDRKYYAPGEPIWFQSYLTAGYLHEASPFSANVYVELYAESDSLVAEKLIFSEGGFGQGVIDVPQQLTEGNYVLRAYTNWMRNFDQNFFFEKPIVVVTGSELESYTSTANNKIDLQFFPEGGNLVSGIPAKVGFKAINSLGKGIYVEGEVHNSTGTKVTNFSTEHDGMGLFTLLPQKGESYSVKLTGKNETYSLPKLENEGYGIQVIQRPNQLRLIFRANVSNPSKGRFKALIHTRGLVSHTIEVDLSKGEALGVISTDEIPAGISHITLFDENDRPLLERLVFIERPIETSLALDKNSYLAREKLTTKIKLNDTNGGPFRGMMSMSVLDMDKVIDGSPEQTIYSELLLSSDLKGYVDNPMYYFNGENTEAKKHLDLVMMTHGWSRFVWDDLMNDNYPGFDFPVELGVSLQGTLYRESSKKTESSGKVTLVNNRSFPPLILETETDKDGRFSFQNLLVYKSDNLLLKGKNSKDKDNVRFEVDTLKERVNAPLPNFKSIFSQEELLEKEDFLQFKKERDMIERAFNPDSLFTDLGTVMVEGSKLQVEREDKQLKEKTAYGRGTSAFDFTEWSATGAYTNIFSALVGKFPGVTVRMGPTGEPTVVIRAGGFTYPALFLLDDVPTDAALISGLSPMNFSRVVLFKGLAATAIFGDAGKGGVMAFYTKSADGISLSPEELKNSNTMIVELPYTYDQPREFYAPKYDVQKPEDAKPDKRAVLHWQTMIELDENGEATIEFWNSDDAKQIMIDVQGLTNSGIPFFINKTYAIGKN
ncbi:Plug domain-containing protein [Roseivirga sp.]|uniref:TonB-dependent receptor n=1 Tax=Roseivirga sp. TaxID=1964215 RepID=UPI002B271B1A|nr:Plug domain-containing protein [Roseivirga sp.]